MQNPAHDRKPEISTLLKLYTILLLAEGHRHGYELIKELSRMTAKPVSPAQVYPFLKELAAAGQIRIEETGERDKKVYEFTRKGRALSQGIISRLSGMLDSGIRSRLVRCEHCDCEVYSGAHREKVRGKTRYFCCRACARACKPNRR